MKILTAAEMQTADRATAEQFGTPTLILMRNAATALVRFARNLYPAAYRITVLAGGGNNGGDGMMAARLLLDAGLDVTTILLADPEKLKGDAKIAYEELLQRTSNTHAGGITIIRDAPQLEDCEFALDTDLIFDAVLGTGFRAPMRGLALEALGWLRKSTAPILSVDLPSGWDADATTSYAEGPVYPADAVLTFSAPKPAHVFGQLTRHWDAPIAVSPIGSPDAAILSKLDWHWAGTAKSLTEGQRRADSNKGTYGHVLVVGGSAHPTEGTKSGAPAMSALAALRAGAGLVTVAIPTAILPIVASIAPELMTTSIETTSIEKLLARKTVLAIGPGLGSEAASATLIHTLLSGNTLPAVLDADALNLLAADPSQLRTLAKDRTLVLTPHPGEMARLTGLTVAQVQSNRLDTARSFACEHGVTLILKGSRTLIAHPDGRLAINTTGNPAQAKGGSGDILTGIVAALLAQHPDKPVEAIEAAVCLHGLAADIALTRHDQHTLLATDTLPYLAEAYRYPFRQEAGIVWLQGARTKTGKETSH